MPMTMVRRPYAVRRMHPEVRKDIEITYEALADTVISFLQEEITGWAHQPDFTKDISVTTKKWRMTIKWDRRTKSGQIYEWVKEGTGERGNNPEGTKYDIFPKKAKALGFNLPLVTKSTSPHGVAPSVSAPPGAVYTQHVEAPGIFPRDLGKNTYDHLKSSKPGSFRNANEASVKRTFRRLGYY